MVSTYKPEPIALHTQFGPCYKLLNVMNPLVIFYLCVDTNFIEETSDSSIAQQYPSNLTRRSSQESGSVSEDSENIDESMLMMMTMVTSTRRRGVKSKK